MLCIRSPYLPPQPGERKTRRVAIMFTEEEARQVDQLVAYLGKRFTTYLRELAFSETTWSYCPSINVSTYDAIKVLQWNFQELVLGLRLKTLSYIPDVVLLRLSRLLKDCQMALNG